MKRFFYLFLILFSFQIIVAQSTPAETAILDKLRKHATTHYTDLKLKEKHLLQLKAESEKLNYNLGILISGDYLMGLYLDQGKNKDVIKLGDQLKIIANNEKDIDGYISSIYNRNALALGYLGLSDASLKDFRKAIHYAEDIKNANSKLYMLSQFYHKMGLQYSLKRFENKNLRDSLLYTLNKSTELAKQISDSSKTVSKDMKYDIIGFNHIRLGIFYLEQTNIKGSLELAEKHLNQSLSIYQDKKYNLPQSNKITLFNQLSWLYMEKKEYQKSIDYANRALELEKKYKLPENRVESFEFLASSYMEIGEKEKAKFYMDKYSFLKDSIADVDRTAANKTVKKLVAEVKDEATSSTRKLLTIIGISVLLAGIITVILWRRKNKIHRRNFEEMLEKLKKEKALPDAKIQNSLGQPSETYTDSENKISVNKTFISTETEERLIKSLEWFEESEEFLQKDITLTSLAVKLNTNTKYLSDLIKLKKSQSFAGYINNLRVSYVVQKLYNEPKYREYKISYLAEESGFASPQVFNTVFKKINGVTPYYFISKLKDENL